MLAIFEDNQADVSSVVNVTFSRELVFAVLDMILSLLDFGIARQQTKDSRKFQFFFIFRRIYTVGSSFSDSI